jgi:hypothetical protein
VVCHRHGGTVAQLAIHSHDRHVLTARSRHRHKSVTSSDNRQRKHQRKYDQSPSSTVRFSTATLSREFGAAIHAPLIISIIPRAATQFNA